MKRGLIVVVLAAGLVCGGCAKETTEVTGESAMAAAMALPYICAELLNGFHDQHGRWPQSQEELEAYMGSLPGGLDERLEIESLTEADDGSLRLGIKLKGAGAGPVIPMILRRDGGMEADFEALRQKGMAGSLEGLFDKRERK